MESATVDNAAKTRRYYQELWNERNFDVIPNWISQEFIGHYTSLPEPVRGVDGFRSFADDLLTAFPDLRMSVRDTVAEGDKVASRIELSGTHRGELLGYAPTGLAVAVTFLAIERYVDGLCVEEWVNADDLGLARQIKALPEPGTRGERIGHALHRLNARRLRKQARR
jgi:predicted ester cyclase